jgi:ATP-binding cassette subfamily B protein
VKPAASESSAASTAAASPAGRPLIALLPFLRPYRALLLGAAAFLVLAATATLLLPQAVRQIIDHGFSAADAAFVDRYFLGLLAVAAVLAVASAARFYFVSRLGEQVVADLRSAVYGRLLRQELAFYETTKVGELLSRLNTDTELIQTVVGSSASVAARNVVMLIGSLLLLFLTSPRLSLMIVLGIPAVVVPILVFGRKVQRLSKDSQDRIADLGGIAGEALGAIETVQGHARQAQESARYSSAVRATLAAARRRITARALLVAAVILLVFGAIAVTLWVGAKAVLAGTLSGGELGQFVIYAVIAAGAVGALSEVWGEVSRASGAMVRLAELLQRTSLIVERPDATAPLAPQAEIRFEQVSFRYPSRPDQAALEGFSLHIAPGQTVALVGRSGAGKSTAIKLLGRFHDVQSGVVSVAGLDVRDWPLDRLREFIAVVPQEAMLFAASAADNIRYGRPDATLEQVHAAALAAEADEFIRALPQGYDSQLGERGVRLSGGQKQRIAIARALLKDAPILLLDEATSHLDAHSERAVQIALERLMQGRTVLVIAHRLATVQRADRIVVLDGGKAVASGTHAQLLAEGGLYAELAHLQFAGNS